MRDQLVAQIELSKSVMKPYSGFIFLCGGLTDIKSEKPASVRDAVQRELTKTPSVERRIRVAENYKDWSHDSMYRDLVSFERHLAELSSVIVLVLESPGAIAELGLFSAIDEFKRKLLVFIETGHYKESSFIRLGPIDYLEKIYTNNAHCHRWLQGNGKSARFDANEAARLQPELAEAVRARAQVPTPECLVNLNQWLHVALLTCDLLGLCAALTLREVKGLLSGFGCTWSETDVRQLLYLLERVELVAMEPKGDQRYYVGVDSREHVRFSFREAQFDAMRFRSDSLMKYETEDKKRFRAIQEVRARHA